MSFPKCEDDPLVKDQTWGKCSHVHCQKQVILLDRTYFLVWATKKPLIVLHYQGFGPELCQGFPILGKEVKKKSFPCRIQKTTNYEGKLCMDYTTLALKTRSGTDPETVPEAWLYEALQ